MYVVSSKVSEVNTPVYYLVNRYFGKKICLPISQCKLTAYSVYVLKKNGDEFILYFWYSQYVQIWNAKQDILYPGVRGYGNLCSRHRRCINDWYGFTLLKTAHRSCNIVELKGSIVSSYRHLLFPSMMRRIAAKTLLVEWSIICALSILASSTKQNAPQSLLLL